MSCIVLWEEINSIEYFDGLVQECGNFSATAKELPQSETKPLILPSIFFSLNVAKLMPIFFFQI